MNSEPPTGNDLQSILVDMKRTVLEQADSVRPLPVRRRHVWPVVGLVTLVVVGAASGAYAAGLVPENLFGAPAATPTLAPSATATSTPSAIAPPPETPASSPAPSPTTAFALDQPSTWTISFTEVGPVALGASYEGEIDDLGAAYTDATGNCPNPDVSFWHRDGSVNLAVVRKDGVVSGVSVGDLAFSDPSYRTTAPTTAAGAGIGTTLDELKTLYPAIAKTGSEGPGGGTGAFDYWSIRSNGRFITFELGDDGVHVGAIWVSTNPQPPYEYCT